MLYLALGLFLLAVVLLVVDIYIEGFGVIGVIGLVGVAASLFISVAFIESPLGILVVAGKIILLVPGTYLFYRFLKNRQLDGRFVLTETLAEDKVDLSGLTYFMGKEGITKTALRPHGNVDFNGSNVEVRSESKYIPANKRVKVVDVRDNKVFVALVENHN